jgi:hypothetical protein
MKLEVTGQPKNCDSASVYSVTNTFAANNALCLGLIYYKNRDLIFFVKTK